MYRDLTKGNITKTLLVFSLPMIAGNLLQQFYNIADTLIVGKFLGRDALAAVGSAYTLMTFLTSILLGMSMGAGALFAIYQGQGSRERLRAGIVQAFGLISLLTVILYIAVYLWLDPIMIFLRVPDEVYALMREYLWIIFIGLAAVFLYNFYAPGVSGRLSPAQYRAGPVVCAAVFLGRRGRGSGYGDCPVCIRCRNIPVYGVLL